jgi:hypothetical protein
MVQPIIHLPNKAHSIIRPLLLHGTMRERIIDGVKRAFTSTLAKYRLMSTDPQFVEREFLRDAEKAYRFFLHSLSTNNLQRIKGITTCTLFRVNVSFLFKVHGESTGDVVEKQAHHGPK